jgi:hypothetical protein
MEYSKRSISFLANQFDLYIRTLGAEVEESEEIVEFYLNDLCFKNGMKDPQQIEDFKARQRAFLIKKKKDECEKGIIDAREVRRELTGMLD